MDRSERDADFSAWVAAHQQWLLRLGYLLCDNPADAEDLVQSSLAAVYRRWDSIDGSHRAYVRRAMTNTYTSWWRRPGRRRETPNSDLVNLIDPPAPSDGHADTDLERAIATLPRQQRAVVVLRYWEDLTEVQTAQVLGCSVGTVKSHSRRAMAALRSDLQEVTA